MQRLVAAKNGNVARDVFIVGRRRREHWQQQEDKADYGTHGERLMVVPRHERAALADQEIEVGAIACLQHMVDVKLLVAALERRLGRLPARAARGEFALAHQELKLALRHV